MSPTDVSPTESSWMLRSLDIVPLTDVFRPWTSSCIDSTTHGPQNAWESRPVHGASVAAFAERRLVRQPPSADLN